MTQEAVDKVVCDVRISISPASSRDELIAKSYKATKANPKAPPPQSKHKDSAYHRSRLPEGISSALTSGFERWWIYLFAGLLLISMGLSIFALTQDDDRWLETSHGGRVGWRAACVDTPETKDGIEVIVGCRDGDAQSIDAVIGSTAGQVSDSILALFILAWTLPVVTIGISSYCTSKETCCHGFVLSIFWGVTGSALCFLSFWFRSLVNNYLANQSHTLLNVSCLNPFNDDIDVCSDVTTLTACLAKCKAMGEDIVCVGYRDCRLRLRQTECDTDGIGCEATMGWAMMASLGSSAIMVVMSVVLALGAWRISKHL